MNWQEQAEALWGKHWQAVLARTCGYSSRTIRRWKVGQRTPDPEVLKKLEATYLLWIGDGRFYPVVEKSFKSFHKQKPPLITYEPNDDFILIDGRKAKLEWCDGVPCSNCDNLDAGGMRYFRKHGGKTFCSECGKEIKEFHSKNTSLLKEQVS